MKIIFMFVIQAKLKTIQQASQNQSIIYLPTLSSKSTSARSKYKRALNLQL